MSLRSGWHRKHNKQDDLGSFSFICPKCGKEIDIFKTENPRCVLGGQKAHCKRRNQDNGGSSFNAEYEESYVFPRNLNHNQDDSE